MSLLENSGRTQQIASFCYHVYFCSFLHGCCLLTSTLNNKQKVQQTGLLHFSRFKLPHCSSCSFCQRPKWTALRLFSSYFFFLNKMCLPTSLQEGMLLHSSFIFKSMEDAFVQWIPAVYFCRAGYSSSVVGWNLMMYARHQSENILSFMILA